MSKEERFQYVGWQVRQLIYEINYAFVFNEVNEEILRKCKRLDDYLTEYYILQKELKKWVYL
jgi:hypothetical protein